MQSERPDDARPTEEPLLPRIARGDAGAVRVCLARYGALVWAMARRLAPADAEDAVQDVFLDLWKSAARFDTEVASEPVFVAMIARRRLIDRRRRAGRRPPPTSPAELPPLADPASGPDVCAEASMAAQALDALRPEQREVLLLATCFGQSHEEIAQQTGLPLGTVKSHARRGLLRIRALLLGVEDSEAGEGERS
jgi:RNA polymerase sigma-70 factor (ECF subfamily)